MSTSTLKRDLIRAIAVDHLTRKHPSAPITNAELHDAIAMYKLKTRSLAALGLILAETFNGRAIPVHIGHLLNDTTRALRHGR